MTTITKALGWQIILYTLIFTKIAHTAPMNVSATVADTCQFGTITDINFGAISGLFTAPVDSSSGSIVITCTPNSSYTLTIDAGANATAESRRMTNGTNFINYSLYQDSGHTTPWGDTNDFGNGLTATGDGTAHSFSVFASIPNGQTPVEAGNYSDIVVVNFTF